MEILSDNNPSMPPNVSEPDLKVHYEGLLKKLTYWNERYHNSDKPVVSDAVYDKTRRLILAIEKEHPSFKPSSSVIDNVGAKPNSRFAKRAHVVKMYSLDNAFSEETLEKFCEDAGATDPDDERNPIEGFMAEPKIDGLSISLLYKKGIFTQATTRGNGEIGEDVTANIRASHLVPETLRGKVPELLEIRGEIYMKKSVLRELNEDRASSGAAAFSNTRNAAAGALRQIDPAETARRKLSLFVYAVGAGGDELSTNTQQGLLVKFLYWGFKVNTLSEKVANLEKMLAYKSHLEKVRPNLDYDIDGIVFKVNLFPLQKKMGFTGRAPKWAIAWKFKAEKAEATVSNITMQVGRTGVVTPVAELVPVEIGGVVVRRATLHNKDEIDRLDIRTGDTVLIQRAGEVIPQIVSVVPKLEVERNEPFYFPKVCPSCQSPLHQNEGEVAWKCVNGLVCPAQALGRLVHFVSREAFNIDGLGESALQLLLDKGFVKTPLDLFTLKEERSRLLYLPGLGEKSVDNLRDAIEASRRIPLQRAIYALGIPNIGKFNAMVMAKAYKDFPSWTSSMLACLTDASERTKLLSLSGIGETILESIITFFSNATNCEIVDALGKTCDILPMEPLSSPDVNNALNGKTIVFTGTLADMSRESATILSERSGAKVSNSLSAKTDYLVCGENPGSKADKAKKLGVKILTKDTWLALLEG